jgi:hypothetical protein
VQKSDEMSLVIIWYLCIFKIRKINLQRFILNSIKSASIYNLWDVAVARLVKTVNLKAVKTTEHVERMDAISSRFLTGYQM